MQQAQPARANGRIDVHSQIFTLLSMALASGAAVATVSPSRSSARPGLSSRAPDMVSENVFVAGVADAGTCSSAASCHLASLTHNCRNTAGEMGISETNY